MYLIPSTWNLVMTLRNPCVDDDVDDLPSVDISFPGASVGLPGPWKIRCLSRSVISIYETIYFDSLDQMSNPIGLAISIYLNQ